VVRTKFDIYAFPSAGSPPHVYARTTACALNVISTFLLVLETHPMFITKLRVVHYI